MIDFHRILAFVEELEERSAGRIEPFSFGRAFFNDRFPVVWDVNFVRIETQPPTWREVRDAVEDVQGRAGLSHRKLHLPDVDWAPALADEARRDGWEATPLIFMVRRGPGDKRNGGRAREVEYERVRPLRSLLAHRQPWATSDDDVRQVLAANRRRMDLVGARFFAVEADGKLVAAADLYRSPGLAQIEDVETMKEYRGRGFATDVVLEAAAAAGEPSALLFLIADENDWPKKLYERLGFEAVGRKYHFLKPPREGSP